MFAELVDASLATKLFHVERIAELATDSSFHIECHVASNIHVVGVLEPVLEISITNLLELRLAHTDHMGLFLCPLARVGFALRVGMAGFALRVGMAGFALRFGMAGFAFRFGMAFLFVFGSPFGLLGGHTTGGDCSWAFSQDLVRGDCSWAFSQDVLFGGTHHVLQSD